MSDNLATVLDVTRHPKYSVSHITAVNIILQLLL